MKTSDRFRSSVRASRSQCGRICKAVPRWPSSFGRRRKNFATCHVGYSRGFYHSGQDDIVLVLEPASELFPVGISGAHRATISFLVL